MTGRLNINDYTGTPFLTGSQIPPGVRQVRFQILRFVNIPGARTQLSAEISETYGCVYFGFNISNVRVLEGLGVQDLQQIVGKTIVCQVGMQPNPQQNNRMVPALLVVNVE